MESELVTIVNLKIINGRADLGISEGLNARFRKGCRSFGGMQLASGMDGGWWTRGCIDVVSHPAFCG